MSSRHGRYSAALGGLILAITLSLGIVQVSQAQPGKTDQQVKANAEADGWKVVSTEAATQNAPAYKPRCDKAPDSEEHPDCQQRRSTRATEQQARWAFWQVWVGIAGTLAVLGSLFYTAKAAIAAEEAARAAQASLHLGEKTAERQLRAYVFPEKLGLLDGSYAEPPNVPYINKPGAQVVLKNSGQTPAYRLRHWSDIRVLDRRYEHTLVVPTDGLPMPGASDIGADGTVSKMVQWPQFLSPQELEQLKAVTHAIYVYGRIEYADAFGKEHFTNYRLAWAGVYPPPQNHQLSYCDGGNESDLNPSNS